MEEQPKLGDRIVVIKNVQEAGLIEVGIERDHRGNQTYRNLPAELQDLMFNFSNDEIWENFLQVMECLATMHAMLRPDVSAGEDQKREIEQLPSAMEFQESIKEHATFRTDDPTKKYQITSNHKLGSGGFAKVFKVTHRESKQSCALKFIET